jgi:FixJ family two-component response regulator
VIIMSGHLMARDALDKGPTDFLPKPFLIEVALGVIGNELAKARDGA